MTEPGGRAGASPVDAAEAGSGVLVSLAGVAAYAMPGAYGLLVPAGPVDGAWWAVYLLGLVTFVALALAPVPERVGARVLLPALLVLAPAAFLLDGRDGMGGAPLAVAAATAGLMLSARGVAGVVVGFVVVIGVGSLVREGAGFALVLTVLYAGLVVFAAYTGLNAASERALRTQHAAALASLTRAHEELRAARDDLAEQSRAAERLRISRELHDLVGHQLAGLAVHLEVASHLSEGPAHEHVESARTAAKSLLGAVREVVATLRDEPDVHDLRTALEAVVAAVPHPPVSLDVSGLAGDGLADVPARVSHVALRCVQEAATNAVRHAGATGVTISVARDLRGTLLVEVADDGVGGVVVPGNGLTGMRERVEEVGGTLDVRPGDGGRGLTVRAALPTGDVP